MKEILHRDSSLTISSLPEVDFSIFALKVTPGSKLTPSHPFLGMMEMYCLDGLKATMKQHFVCTILHFETELLVFGTVYIIQYIWDTYYM